MNEEQEETLTDNVEVVKKPLAENPKKTEHKKKSRVWWGVGAVATVIGLGVGAYYGYDYYMHADDVEVPKAQSFVEYEESRDGLCAPFDKISLDCSVKWETNDDADRGYLLSQSISSGAVVSPDSKIVLKYSDGPAVSSFPNLSGQELEESKETLYNMGITVSDVKEVDDSTVPAGRIVSTSIEPGTQVNNGTEVSIQISSGAAVVPDWIGETKEFVEADAQSKNLEVSFETVESEDVVPGVVVNQSVKAGEISSDSSVKVTIAKAPEITSVEIPDVVGLTEEEAVSQLAASGFTNITTSAVPSSEATKRSVIDVAPGVGQKSETDSLIVVIITEPSETPNNDAETTQPADEN